MNQASWSPSSSPNSPATNRPTLGYLPGDPYEIVAGRRRGAVSGRRPPTPFGGRRPEPFDSSAARDPVPLSTVAPRQINLMALGRNPRRGRRTPSCPAGQYKEGEAM